MMNDVIYLQTAQHKKNLMDCVRNFKRYRIIFSKEICDTKRVDVNNCIRICGGGEIIIARNKQTLSTILITKE